MPPLTSAVVPTSIDVPCVNPQSAQTEVATDVMDRLRPHLVLGGLASAALSASVAIAVFLFAWPSGAPLALAAMVAASMMALLALVALRRPPIPSRSLAFSPVAPSNEARPADRSGAELVVDIDGAVVSAEASMPWAVGEPLLDRVHLADRVSLMRALSALRSGDCPHASVQVRFDESVRGMPQRFRTAHVSMDAADGGDVALRVPEAARNATSGNKPVVVALEKPAVAPQHDLAMVSHELRTPLGAIIGFSELLRAPAGNQLNQAKRDEYVDLIHGAATHLLSIVNAFLDVSKIEAGRYSIGRDRFDLAACISQAVAMVAPHANAKTIAVNQHLDAACGEVVADSRAIRQIVINLVSNAVKFTPEGGCVTVEAERGPDQTTITVADTGIGIAPEDIERLGAPFTQIDNAVTCNADGTGLGLMLVKGLVALHRGEIEINSTPDVGTRVKVTLPLQVNALQAADKPGNPFEPGVGDSHAA